MENPFVIWYLLSSDILHMSIVLFIFIILFILVLNATKILRKDKSKNTRIAFIILSAIILGLFLIVEASITMPSQASNYEKYERLKSGNYREIDLQKEQLTYFNEKWYIKKSKEIE